LNSDLLGIVLEVTIFLVGFLLASDFLLRFLLEETAENASLWTRATYLMVDALGRAFGLAEETEHDLFVWACYCMIGTASILSGLGLLYSVDWLISLAI
jgi:bacteriorhodopsin